MTKKTVSIILLVTFLLGTFGVATASASDINVYIDGSHIEFDVPPQIISDRTMVPMRKIFETLGASVEWDGDNSRITSKKGSTTIILTVGNTVAVVNGEVITLDVPPVVIDDRTLVPIRFVSESLGCDVKWLGESKTILITSDGSVPTPTASPTSAPTPTPTPTPARTAKMYAEYPTIPDFGDYCGISPHYKGFYNDGSYGYAYRLSDISPGSLSDSYIDYLVSNGWQKTTRTTGSYTEPALTKGSYQVVYGKLKDNNIDSFCLFMYDMSPQPSSVSGYAEETSVPDFGDYSKISRYKTVTLEGGSGYLYAYKETDITPPTIVDKYEAYLKSKGWVDSTFPLVGGGNAEGLKKGDVFLTYGTGDTSGVRCFNVVVMHINTQPKPSSQMYPEYPTLHDFGTVTGVRLVSGSGSSSVYVYFYYIGDDSSKATSMLNKYLDTIVANGWVYKGSFETDNNEDVRAFEKGSLRVYVGSGYELGEGFYAFIMVERI